LDWKFGDVRPYLYFSGGLFLVGALGVVWKREQIGKRIDALIASPKRLAFLAIGALLTLTISLSLMEAMLRLVDLPYRTSWNPQEYHRVQFDPVVGWTYLPNNAVLQPFVAGLPPIEVVTGGNGARVLEGGAMLDPRVPSALLVGGSFTFGFGVAYSESFAGQLEQLTSGRLQIVNLGVEAYGTDQALLLLEREIERFDTRVVIYTFINNHIERNHNYDRRLLFRGGRFVGTKPLFGLDAKGDLEIRKQALPYEELSDIRLLAFVNFAWTRWGPKPKLDLTMALIEEMREVSQNHGADFLLVYLSWEEDPILSEQVRAAFSKMGLNWIDLGPAPPPELTSWRIPGDSHPTPAAHRYIAERIAQELARQGSVPP
jgi:hypothetical protein